MGKHRQVTISTTATPSPVPIACVRCGTKTPFPVCEHCRKPVAWSAIHLPKKHREAVLARAVGETVKKIVAEGF